MGYAINPNYTQLEFGLTTGASDHFLITNTPADYGGFSDNLPIFDGEVVASYLDLLIGEVTNTAANINYLTPAQYIQIKKAGGVYTNAHALSNGQFWLTANKSAAVGRLYGSIDITSTIESIGSGGAYEWKWSQGCAHLDDLHINGALSPIIRIIFR
jgi:hypothetical protein